MSMGTTSGTTGTLLNLANSFNSATSTGNVLKVSTTGVSNAAVPLILTNAGTGNSLRVNDDGTDTDTTPFIIDASGSMGIGTTAPAEKLSVVGNIVATGFIKGGVVVNTDTITSVTANFSSANTIRSVQAGACGTLNITNVSEGGYYTLTLLNTTAYCTTIQLNGATTNVKLPSGYMPGDPVTGAVYTFIYDGLTLWTSSVGY